MSRVAGRLILALLAGLPASTSAQSADLVLRRDAPLLDGTACRGPEIVTAHFEEQVCSRGASGYAECHWVSRVHDVEVGERCVRTATAEKAYPARRGAFPPYPRVSSRR